MDLDETIKTATYRRDLKGKIDIVLQGVIRDKYLTLGEIEQRCDEELKIFASLPNCRCIATPVIGRLTRSKETHMKIFEAVVVKLDFETKLPSEVLKIVPPFVAISQRAAIDRVLVDFARENTIDGKDLAGYSVCVRDFRADA